MDFSQMFYPYLELHILLYDVFFGGLKETSVNLTEKVMVILCQDVIPFSLGYFLTVQLVCVQFPACC